MPVETLRSHRWRIFELATRHGARNVLVCGSRVCDQSGPKSDIDLLVDVEPGRTLLDLIAFEQHLERVRMLRRSND
jgi:hypothetical protein